MTRTPTVFFGHGSPVNAIDRNVVTQAWGAIAARIGKPRAILCISAHWITHGTAVTGNAHPPTIHDFGRSLPAPLLSVNYPAPGAPALARRIAEVLAPIPVSIDDHWGLDHGTWSVLVHAYPDADVPVVQLGMDVAMSTRDRLRVGEALRPLRDEGVLVMGTGNIVHNLGLMDWHGVDAEPYPWAARFNRAMIEAVAQERPDVIADYAQMGHDAALSVPDPDHFWPLLYILGARHRGERAEFGPDLIQHKSLGMTSILFGAS